MKQWQSFSILVMTLLLCSSWQVAHGKGLLRSAARGEVATKNASWSQHALATVVAAGLLGGVVALPAAAHELSPEQRARRQYLHQDKLPATSAHPHYHMSGSPSGEMQGRHEQLGAEDEEDNALAWSEEVTQGSGVFYLALHNPDYDHIHHLVYVGDTTTGEPLFAGMFLVGHEEDYLRLYAHDGLVTQGFAQHDVKVFPDPLDLYAEVTVFTIKDLNLRGKYAPVVPELFPVAEVGEELQMVQYGVREDDPDTLFNLPIKQRACKVLDPKAWGELGIGRHTCTALEGAHGSFGAPLFLTRNSNLVGFHGGYTPVQANHAEGMTQEFVDFVIAQQANPTAVDSKDKLAVTWGALKVAQ